MLITRPHYDVVTNYLCSWSESIITLASEKGRDVYDLKGDKAERVRFQSYCKAKMPALLFLNGHGNADVITGHNDEPLVDGSDHFGNSVVYARSCECAKRLGVKLVENGLRTFIGYTRKFIFGYLTTKITRPREDMLAALFLESSNLIVSTLLKGHTAQEADARGKEAMYRNFRKMIASTASYEERYAARWTWGNIKSQVILGSPNGRV